MIVKPKRLIGPEERLVLHAHLRRFEGHVCPVCSTRSWSTAGISSRTVAPEPEDDGPQNIPVVLLYCNNCFYVREFAWLPIVRQMFPSDDGSGVPNG